MCVLFIKNFNEIPRMFVNFHIQNQYYPVYSNTIMCNVILSQKIHESERESLLCDEIW
jgi:hypothetical protein